MAQDDIQGQVVDAQGNPVSGAIVELTKSYQSSPTGQEAVQRTTTDSNGNYIFDFHPDGDGTTQEWHVSAYSHDGTAYVNSFNNPGVTADLPSNAIPDSVVEQWPAADYDDADDKWIGQLNGYDLTGGSATKTTDGNGNTVVSYDGSSGQEHTNSNVAVTYDRISVIIVANPDDTNTRILWSDDTDSTVYGQLGGGGAAKANFGNNSLTDVSSGSSLALYLFDGQLVGGIPENIIEENGTVLSTQTSGQTGFDGFMLGGWAGGGFDFSGDVLESIVYQDATDEDISSEKTRLKSKYAGLSF